MTMKVCLCLLALAAAASAVKVDLNTESFSSASKGGIMIAHMEEVVFESTEGPGYITQQWYTDFPYGSRVRIYFDGEQDPTIDADLLMLIGIGNCTAQNDKMTPWSNRRFGMLAHQGGIYTNVRMPFQKGVKITVTSPTGGPYWYIIRYLLGTPLVVNGFELPDKTRLRLYSVDNKLFQPYDFVHGANVSGKAGWLYMVTLSAQSKDYVFLEACFRLNADGRKEQFLSSGTEDFFLSGFYFNAGPYHGDASGLTCFDGTGMITAYKMFEDDPVFFKNSMRFSWRVGDRLGDPDGCPNVYQHDRHARVARSLDKRPVGAFPDPHPTLTTLHVWVYEYDL